MLTSLLGGVGLFLLGMALMTDGLEAAAGDRLARLLARATARPARAVASGALVTALIQSSSATTVVALGFVGAGVLGLTEAVGVIFGSNLGTTVTAWLVATVGLHLDVGAVALPAVGAGALLRLFTRGTPAHLGMALSGFALVFLGIDVLQEGMGALAGRIDLSEYVGSSLGSRALLVLIGAAMTVLMQSSSAAVATTLAAVHAGTLGFEEAAALVIGQNIGTTVTAVLGAAGGDTVARRVAAAHVLFNVLTGAVAFVALPLFLLAVGSVTRGSSASIQLAAFHTFFNVVGVALLLPAIQPFVAAVRRVVPERPVPLAERLVRLPPIPSARLAAVERTTEDLLFALVGAVRRLLAEGESHGVLDEVSRALALTREAVQVPGRVALAATERQRLVGLLHALDHVERLLEACREHGVGHARATRLDDARARLERILATASSWREGPEAPGAAGVDDVARRSGELAEERRRARVALLEGAADGALGAKEVPALLDGLQWLDRAGYHVWRAVAHLEEARGRETSPRASRTSLPPPE